jgi:MFS transporter, DHA1 family, multidrug resistance protein
VDASGRAVPALALDPVRAGDVTGSAAGRTTGSDPPPRLVLVLGALTALTPMAVDMYLPSLPTLQRAFAAAAASVQFTLAAFFVGLALGQLLYGPLADRFGRKPPPYFGLGLFALASAGCALAPRIETLVALRFVQAAGGCAALVVPRAVVRDLFDAQTSARVFSLLMLVMGVAPILAPLAGGYVLAVGGWRAIFWVLAASSLACAAAVRLLPETRPRATGARFADALLGYAQLLGDRRFLGYALTGGLAMAGMFAYIAGSPFVFIELYGVPAERYGWLFGLNAAGLIAASQLNRLLLAGWRADAVLTWATRAGAGVSLILFAVAVIGGAGLVGLLVPLFGFVATLGLTQPNALAGALAGHAERAGSASALYGTLQFSAATLAGSLVGILHDGSARPMAGVIAGCGVLALTAHRLLVARNR